MTGITGTNPPGTVQPGKFPQDNVQPNAALDIPFMLWPSLAALGKLFPSKRFPGLFYYDTGPANGGSAGDENPERPALILIHGLGDEADTWRHLLPLLAADGFRTLALDLPGFGRSRIPPYRFGLSRHAGAVLELAAALSPPIGAGKKWAPEEAAGVVLVGSSMGAAVAEEAALKARRKYPGLVRGIILMDGCIPQSGPFPLALARYAFSGQKQYRAFRNNPEGAWKSLFPYYADLAAMPEADKDFLRRRVMDRVESSSQETAYFTSIKSMIFHSVFRSAHFRRIKHWPGAVGLVWGEADKIVPLDTALRFRSFCGEGGRTPPLTVIPGAGHLPQQEKPAETAGVIRAFLESPAFLESSVFLENRFS